MQDCVNEFISFVTSEGTVHMLLKGNGRTLTYYIAAEKCHLEQRNTICGKGVLVALNALGFENYAEVLKIYLSKYREVSYSHLLC